MEMYFLKSAVCLAILMLFYKLLLENENMHVFKRFYLLSAVLLSFVIPSITFTSYVDIPAVPYNNLFQVESGGGEEPVEDRTFLPFVLWTMYGLGVLFFGIKFFRNLQQILQKIRRNPQIKAGNTTNVLLKEEVAPHTFWSYIFLNRQKYKERRIPAEVFEHEQAHAVQKHSLDILLMELLQVIFWFHPLLYLVKRAIKLNHEFLADRAVLKKGVRTSTYQETLLAFSSGAAESSLVNSINYSSIKKRFTVMKTHTSKQKIWITSLLLLPLLAGLLYGFSTRQTVLAAPAASSPVETAFTEQASSETLDISIDEKGIIRVDGKQMDLNELRENLEPQKYTNYAINASPSAPKGVMEELMQVVLSLRVEGTVTVCSYGEDSGKSVLNELFTTVQDQEKASPKMIAEYNKLAKHYGAQAITEEIVQEKGFKRMMYIFGLMTEDQRKNAEELPPPPPPAPVSDEQLPPPPPPPSPEEAIKMWDAEGAEFYFNGKKITAQEALNLVKKSPNLKANVTEIDGHKKVEISRAKDEDRKEQSSVSKKAERGEQMTRTETIEHLKELSAEGLVFTYKEQEISLEKALEHLEKGRITFRYYEDGNRRIMRVVDL